MKNFMTKAVGLSALCLSAVMFSSSAWALGTASGTSIDNRAEINYSVGGSAQDVIESSSAGNSTPGAGNGEDTSFLVDNRVDLAVTENSGDETTVTPNTTGNVTAFTVQNNGNTVQDYILTAADVAAGQTLFTLTDDYDIVGSGGAAGVLSVFVDANGNGTYELATDTGTFIDELAADDSIVVFVVATIDAQADDEQVALVSLTAQTADGGTATTLGAATTNDSGSADDTATVDVVFADAATTYGSAEDGQDTDRDAYLVSSADVSITKTVSVVSDPINGTTNPKAIPGAVLEYSITVSNDAGATADATSVVITDDMDVEVAAGNITYVDDSVEIDGASQTDASDSPTDETTVTDSGTADGLKDLITVDLGTLTAGDSVVITYQVTVVYP